MNREVIVNTKQALANRGEREVRVVLATSVIRSENRLLSDFHIRHIWLFRPKNPVLHVKTYLWVHNFILHEQIFVGMELSLALVELSCPF